MITFFRKLPFRHKIALLSSCITLIALISFHSISNAIFSSAFLETTKEQAISALDLTNQNLNLLLERSETYIRLLSINAELQETLKIDDYEAASNNPTLMNSLNDLTGGAFAPSANVLGCVIYIDGKVFYPQKTISVNDTSKIFTEEYLQSVHRSAAPIWKSSLDRIQYRKSSGTTSNFALSEEYHVVTLSKQIVDRSNGHNLGIITLLLEEKAFSSLYDTETSNYYLINQENLIVSCNQKEGLNQSVFNTLPLTDAELKSLRQESSLTRTLDGKQFMLTLVHNDTLNWDLIALTDLNSFMSKRSNITQILLTVLLVTLAITVLVIWTTASALTKPISILLNVMQEYDGSIPAKRAPDTLKGEMRILGISFNQLLDKIEHNIAEITKIQKQKRTYELRILQEQIQPHFLYNALQTAASLVQLGLYSKSVEHLYALSDFYRLSLNTGKDLISLKDELKIVEDYLMIQHIRYVNVFDYSIDTDNSSLSVTIPKLTLQPLVENAIYHGLKPKGTKGNILIMAYQTENKVTIEITDTGIGMTKNEIHTLLNGRSDNDSSYGIRSVIDRLSLVYENRFQFHIDSQKDNYTSVIIELSLLSEKRE